EDLAERSGLTARAIRAIENGRSARPYPRSVRSLADALELPADLHAGLLAAARPATAVTAHAVVPRQLPAAIRQFTGRAAELRVLHQLTGRAAAQPAAAMIAVISGTAGVG